MSNNRVQQVLSELELGQVGADGLGVSRRQALAALASVGALGSVGTATADDPVGGVIAEEAFLWNFGSEFGGETNAITIDGDSYEFLEDEILLPDGSTGEEILLPNGAEVSEVIAPNGETVWSAIPDSEQYYKIDEGSGDTLNDEIENRDATSTGTLVWVEDAGVAHGWYIELDGTNYVDAVPDDFVGWGADFSVGIEINVETAFGSNNAVFWSWSDGNRILTVGVDGGTIKSGAWDGSQFVSTPAHPEPSAPYNIDLHFTWDSSAQTAELYLDETASTESQSKSATSTAGFSLGARTDGDEDMLGRGVARFGIFDSVVAPTEFTI